MEDTTENFPIFPFIITWDTSVSMTGKPMEATNACVREIQQVIADDDVVGEIARVGIVTFSDEARTLLPLCDLAQATIPEIEVEGGTNFAAAFSETRRAIDAGFATFPKGTRVYAPVVFFLSDGRHEKPGIDWQPALAELRGMKRKPAIVAFGFGDVDTDAIRRIATDGFAFVAKNTDPTVAIREIRNSIINSIRVTSMSVTDQSKLDGLHVEADPSNFTKLESFVIGDE